MRIAGIRLDGLVDELLAVLDEDIRHIERVLERLDELRGAVIKRDEGGLKSLLEEIRVDECSYGLVEKKRRSICGEMADVFGCDINEMNLSMLCSRLAGQRRDAVLSRQQELKRLTGKLGKEHMVTSIFLKECARFNRELLRGILGNGSETVTYDNNGSLSWEVQQGMVSLRL